MTDSNRARGCGHLRVGRRGVASVLRDLSQSGSGKLLFPRHGTGALQAVWLNTAGGITGGDRFALSAEAETGAALSLTTQAAERIYRAQPGAPGEVHTVLTAGARIDWLPQETILFDGAALDRRLDIRMTADARVLACETLLFGRAAMGEVVHRLSFRDRIDLRVDGRLAFADRLRLDGDAAAALTRCGVADGAHAMASVLLAAPGAETYLDPLRAILPRTAGVSAPDRSILFLRLVAPDGFELRRHLIPVLRLLSGADLPRPWTL